MKNKLGDLSQSEMGKYWMNNNFDFFFLSELSNTRNELDQAKIQLEQAKQRIFSLTTKGTQRHEVHTNDYKNDIHDK